MSSSVDVIIKNRTGQSITAKVTRHSRVEGDGSSIDGKVIPEGDNGVYRVIAKTKHHGELDLEFIGGDSGNRLGALKIRSIKDPQEGEESLEVSASQDDTDVSAMGYSNSPVDIHFRRVDFLIVQNRH